jgi:phospholipid/cholesterol/gamma-HCH transport system substrate-binding protein
MNDTRFAWKVGLFVFVGLVLGALLILNFSKGPMVFHSTYKLHITMPTVAGLKPAADVMMAGVPVGKVVATELSLDGRSVDITVEILAKYQIRKGASFHIDALGFLGDQYIEVTPAEGGVAAGQAGEFLTNGASVIGEAPFNMQEAVRSISGLVDQGQKTMKDLDKAINSVNSSILDPVTLTNFVTMMTNFESVTEDAASMAKQVRGMLDANVPSVHVAVSNFATLAQKLDAMADKLDRTISSNTGDVTEAVKNIKAASASLQNLADGLQAGQGLAGRLLKDEKMNADYDNMKTNLATALTAISGMADQFSRFGRSLNENSVWHILFRKPSPTNAPGR